MPIDMAAHRESAKEQARIGSLMELIPHGCLTALEIGARDCYIRRRVTEVVEHVTALDLQKPDIADANVTPVAGDVTELQFADWTFDLVVCTEVLEHLQPHPLQKACDEISRVASRFVLIGVPFRQDTRVGRTRCAHCGKRNPPWGHLNTFDERRLKSLFRSLDLQHTCFVGESRERTNWLSTWLMDLAGNPYGTYHQDEWCVYCGRGLGRPNERSFVQKVLTRGAFWVRRVQSPFVRAHAAWVHMLFRKP